jgi:glutathione peroxidase
MRTTRSTLLACCLAACGTSPTTDTPATRAGVTEAAAKSPATTTMPNVYSLRADSLAGQPVDLADYRGKVTLVVNVASECGYTPQYAGLQKLHAELADRGFAVLGFPSNEFGGQEPGNAAQIQEFCTSKFGVKFPLFAKIATKDGANQSPVYQLLGKATGKLPNWNFCKYLIGKDGNVIGFYPSSTGPESPELRRAIDAAMN